MSTAAIEIETKVGTISSAPREQFALQSSEQLQQHHYDQISAEYETHYSDPYSLQYRRRFIYAAMFDGLNLSGMNVLDAMCGSGQTTEYLLSQNAKVTGLDISNEVMDSFCSRWSNCNAVRRSLLASGLRGESFDCIAIVGWCVAFGTSTIISSLTTRLQLMFKRSNVRLTRISHSRRLGTLEILRSCLSSILLSSESLSRPNLSIHHSSCGSSLW